MDDEISSKFNEISAKLDVLKKAMDFRIDKIKDVVFAYMEAGSSISLATVKANLKSV